jgi:ribosomal protein S18 acetylase RimI-like enzyme
MSDIEIRPAEQADLGLLIETFGDEEFFTDRLARQQATRGILLTAWTQQDPIGDLYIWLEPADEVELREHLPEVPLLNHVEVHPDHRNRGIGTELMFAAEHILAERGYDQVALAVRIDNLDAHRLYLRLGYKMWPHPCVVCMSVVKLPDGTRKHCAETCDILVKRLRDTDA